MTTKELIVVRHTLKRRQAMGGYTIVAGKGTQWVDPPPSAQRSIALGYFGDSGEPTIAYEFTIDETEFDQYPLGAKVTMALEAHE